MQDERTKTKEQNTSGVRGKRTGMSVHLGKLVSKITLLWDLKDTISSK